jgi:hypothetical protein
LIGVFGEYSETLELSLALVVLDVNGVEGQSLMLLQYLLVCFGAVATSLVVLGRS